ncbi:AraC family transcriptional regulator [Paenibacillus eucommiae]|uniref:AraC-like DNA-binding protein n=1 Tax=Paenibacillus eucommiae TaxID=1355755 RepID=A0ABS4J080_9BACL|nr:AraC family transcriptional regulator [Paenibacillus eucommiae]MBP1992516.1 AraC-like DNA-binding protein [Paenibacillus eucommiae]
MKIEVANNREDKQTNFHFDNIYLRNPKRYESIILYQIGDLSCKAGYIVGEHKQYCYEISYIVSGRGFYYMNGQSYPVQEGDIIVNVPGGLHDCRADDVAPFRYFYLGFDFINNSGEQSPFTHIRKMLNQIPNPITTNKVGIDTPFVNIFKELLDLNNYSAFMVEAYLRQIIVLAYRSFYSNWATEYAPVMRGDDSESKQTVYEVINYIDLNLHQIAELTEIADKLHYSYPHLSHLFSKEVGLTIKDYYNLKRFEKAVEWLKSGELKVTQIAEKLHYQSIHTFSKAFRKNFGIAPTEFQALYKQKYD